jgi:RHS repeat-associated protein
MQPCRKDTNELLSVRETSNGSTNLLTVTYSYDAAGDQVSQSEWQSSGGGVVTSRFAYDAQGNVWAELTPSNTVEMRYIREAGEANLLLAQIDGSGNLSWYLTDMLGSVRDILNAAGMTITDHIDYGAFGNIILETNSAASGRAFLYTGLAQDRSLGIVLAQHRALLANIGRWMQQDPLGFRAGDANLYRYVQNSALNFTDRSGLQLIGAFTIDTISFTTGAVVAGFLGVAGFYVILSAKALAITWALPMLAVVGLGVLLLIVGAAYLAYVWWLVYGNRHPIVEEIRQPDKVYEL